MQQKRNVLVIGGNGFIGSNIVEELKNKGFAVSVLDILPPRFAGEGVQYHCGSVSDQKLLNELVRNKESLIYLKSSTTPATSMIDAAKAYCEDLPELMGVCEVCLRQGVRKIVFSSSGGTVYGDLRVRRPYREEDLTYPRNHYGIAKVAAENILLMQNALHGMENVILRVSNPYGRGQSTLSGVGAITSFAEKIIQKQPIRIFGDGNIIRDYIDVSDVARAFVMAVEQAPVSGSPIFNIGCGRGFSLLQIVDLLQEYLQSKAQIEFLPQREFDVEYNVLDVTKAARILGFTPVISPEEGIRQYVQQLSHRGN
jgi:UDP-glucose 4-epimerase